MILNIIKKEIINIKYYRFFMLRKIINRTSITYKYDINILLAIKLQDVGVLRSSIERLKDLHTKVLDEFSSILEYYKMVVLM